MKIVVIGDIVVPCELLVEAAEFLGGSDQNRIVPIRWPAETRQEFQKKAFLSNTPAREVLIR